MRRLKPCARAHHERGRRRRCGHRRHERAHRAAWRASRGRVERPRHDRYDRTGVVAARKGHRLMALMPRFLVCWLALVTLGAVAQPAVETPRTIRVVMDNDYAPFAFQ